MYTLNIVRAINKASVNEIRDFIFENYYEQIAFSNKKRRAFIQFDPCNAKQHYRSFIRRKNRKSVKQSKIIIYQSKTFENTNPIDIKSVIIEYPKTSHNMSKTIRQVEKVASNSS